MYSELPPTTNHVVDQRQAAPMSESDKPKAWWILAVLIAGAAVGVVMVASKHFPRDAELVAVSGTVKSLTEDPRGLNIIYREGIGRSAEPRVPAPRSSRHRSVPALHPRGPG